MTTHSPEPPVAMQEAGGRVRTDDSARLVFLLAGASATLGGVGLIFIGFPVISIFLIISGIVTGCVGVWLGRVRRRSGPAGVAGACAVFCGLMLGVSLLGHLPYDPGDPTPTALDTPPPPAGAVPGIE
jgi:hypothetical protein